MEQRWQRWLGEEKREIEDQGRSGMGLLLTHTYRTRPVGIPGMSGICGLAIFVLKIHSLDSNPLLYYYLVQKVYNLDPN